MTGALTRTLVGRPGAGLLNSLRGQRGPVLPADAANPEDSVVTAQPAADSPRSRPPPAAVRLPPLAEPRRPPPLAVDDEKATPPDDPSPPPAA